MKLVYANQEPPAQWKKSVFLAGPSPREAGDPDWRRDEAIPLLEKMGFDGVVFIPLPDGDLKPWPKDEAAKKDLYDAQVGWETRCLNLADVVLFWVPRNLEKLPAFTTNVEFGLWASSGKSVLGCPPGAAKMGFLVWHANRLGMPFAENLAETLRLALGRIGDGAERTGAEREVPLHLWRTDAFQSWYRAQQAAGNRLDGAHPVSVHPEASGHPFA